jgi:hypothetical protein
MSFEAKHFRHVAVAILIVTRWPTSPVVLALAHRLLSMAMNVCGNPQCQLPGRMFGADRWEAYCSRECRQAAHRRLMAVPCSMPTTVMRNRPAPVRKATLTVREGFRALADEMPGDDDRVLDILARNVRFAQST